MPYDIGVAPVDGIGTGGSGNAVIALMDLVREAAVKHGLYLGITANAYNPDGMRGIETIGYELVEQLPTLPMSTCRQAVAVCSHRDAGVGAAWCVDKGGRGATHGVRADREVCRGRATGTGRRSLRHHYLGAQLPSPPDGQEAAAAVVRSAGWGTTVSDEETGRQRSLATAEGVFVEPASAAGLAGLIRDVECGRVQHSDQAVLVLTGAGWKDLGRYSLAAEKVSTVPLAEVAGRVAGWAALPSEGKRVAS